MVLENNKWTFWHLLATNIFIRVIGFEVLTTIDGKKCLLKSHLTIKNNIFTCKTIRKIKSHVTLCQHHVSFEWAHIMQKWKKETILTFLLTQFDVWMWRIVFLWSFKVFFSNVKDIQSGNGSKIELKCLC